MYTHKMKWIKVETRCNPEECEFYSNVTHSRILIYAGGLIEYIEEHGWDGEEYYFHNGTGKVKNVTHWMPLPKPPEEN